jgi:hypothetical protein
MGAVEGNRPVRDNDWEAVLHGGDAAIERWIATQLAGKSCTIVLIGTATAGRKWVTHEIVKSWNDGKGVLGVYIHNLVDSSGRQSQKGRNPFELISMGANGKLLSSVAKAYDSPYGSSTSVYNHIKLNLTTWVEEAIQIRNGVLAARR